MDTRFHSPLASELQEFLVWKRALGRRDRAQEKHLRSFDRVVKQDTAEHREVCLERAITRWLRHTVRQPSTNHVMLSVVRQFCLFRRRRGPDCYVPGVDIVATGRSPFRPYLLSVDEGQGPLGSVPGRTGAAHSALPEGPPRLRAQYLHQPSVPAPRWPAVHRSRYR